MTEETAPLQDEDDCEACTLSVLIHGPSKVGKSTLASTSQLPILVLDAEGGWKFLARAPETKALYGRSLRVKQWNPLKEKIPQHDGTWDICSVSVTEWPTVQRTYEWLAQGKHQFRSVVIDSITEIQRRCRQMILADPMDQFQFQDWGALLRVMDVVIRGYRDLANDGGKTPIRMVTMIAETKNTDGQHGPNMQGGIRDQLPYLFDVVGYLFKTQDKDDTGTAISGQFSRNLLISPHDPKFVAGSRVEGILGTVVKKPNITHMHTKIFQDEGEMND